MGLGQTLRQSLPIPIHGKRTAAAGVDEADDVHGCSGRRRRTRRARWRQSRYAMGLSELVSPTPRVAAQRPGVGVQPVLGPPGLRPIPSLKSSPFPPLPNPLPTEFDERVPQSLRLGELSPGFIPFCMARFLAPPCLPSIALTGLPIPLPPSVQGRQTIDMTVRSPSPSPTTNI